MANKGTPAASSSPTMAWTGSIGAADRLAEAAAPGGNQLGISGIDFAELARGLVERPAAVQRLVPLPQIGVCDELQARFVVRDLAHQESVGIPAVKDVADVEDDGRRV
jgi:hypothetical protein